jgi:hypothetical protein
MLDADAHVQRLMRIAYIFERSGDVIGAIFMYREVILSQDEISASLAKRRVKALAMNAPDARQQARADPPELGVLHHDAAS